MRWLPFRPGRVWHWIGRPVAMAAPFGLFFWIMFGGDPRRLLDYYLVALVYSLFINTAVEVNQAWVLPRLHGGRDARAGKPLLLEIASFALASTFASMLASVTLHLTIVPGMLGSGAAALRILVWSLLFGALIIGIVYASLFQKRYVEHVREEAERRAREGHELRTAAAIQQALLPPATRSGPGYSLAGASIPCRTIGGDFYDTFDLPDGGFAFVLGDVAGKGPPAAILAAMVQGIFASSAGPGPAGTVGGLNRTLLRRAVETRFATIFYGVLETGGRLVTCNAGHNPGLLIRADGSMEKLEVGGLMVGAFDFASYEEERVGLGMGDTLVLYSDGVTDALAPSGEDFGEERLLQALAGVAGSEPEAILERVLGAIRTFVAEAEPADDVTLLVVRFRAADGAPAV